MVGRFAPPPQKKLVNINSCFLLRAIWFMLCRSQNIHNSGSELCKTLTPKQQISIKKVLEEACETRAWVMVLVRRKRHKETRAIYIWEIRSELSPRFSVATKMCVFSLTKQNRAWKSIEQPVGCRLLFFFDFCVKPPQKNHQQQIALAVRICEHRTTPQLA